VTEMTPKQMQILEPFAQTFAGIDAQVRALPDDELKDLAQASYSASMTNCWSCTFRAAQYLIREIRAEMSQREQRALAVHAEEAKGP
jgi:hypothetical protein